MPLHPVCDRRPDQYKDCHMDPLEQLCSVYQDGRPLEEYIHEFLTCSKPISLDRWTLLDCFWSGLDEEIAQQMPGAGPAGLCPITSTWLGLSVDPVFSPSAQKYHPFVPAISSQVLRCKPTSHTKVTTC